MENGLTGSGRKYFTKSKHARERDSSTLFTAAKLGCIGGSCPVPGEEPGEETQGKEEVGLLQVIARKLPFLFSNLIPVLIGETVGKMARNRAVGSMPQLSSCFIMLQIHCFL